MIWREGFDGEMAFLRQKCGQAIGASLRFDSEADAKDRRESKLHAAVSSASEDHSLKEFAKHLKDEKPKDKTGSAFSLAVQWQFVLFQHRQNQQ